MCVYEFERIINNITVYKSHRNGLEHAIIIKFKKNRYLHNLSNYLV